MNEALFIEGDDCPRCHLMKPHAKKWADANGYEFQVFRFDNAALKEFEVQSVPMLVIRKDGIVDKILNEEGIVNLISNKN